MQNKPKTNEFVLRFANVNGTGSASANTIVAKTIFRMGVPIGPKNMFPSNIQGFPTWFEIRVSEKGYTSRRGGVDLMVAMNGQTLAKDSEDITPGGYLLYDASLPLRDSAKRAGVNYLPLPITNIAREELANPRMRGLVQNFIYVGALVALLDLDLDVLTQLMKEQYRGKDKLLVLNSTVLQLGLKYAKEHLTAPLPFKVEKRNANTEHVLIEGNFAHALGCLYAGATVAGWYPITPSTGVLDAFTKLCSKWRIDKQSGKKNYAIVQAEDEISALGIVLGATWMGARAFTATSGPGISLMTEFLGLAYYAEIPAVLFDIQRAGPSTGLPTKSQQADLLLCAYAGHGDTKHILLFPGTALECFEFSVKAFDYADLFQTPVFVMSDLDLGMNSHRSKPITWEDDYQPDRGQVLDREALEQLKGPFYRYFDKEGMGLVTRTYPGVHPKGAYFIRGSGHDKFGRYTEDGDLYMENMERIVRKFVEAAKRLPPPVETKRKGAVRKLGVISFGSTIEALSESLDILEAQGTVLDDLRIRAFPLAESIKDFAQRYDQIVIVEQNRDGQMRTLLINELGLDPQYCLSLPFYDGSPILASVLATRLASVLSGMV